MTVAVIEMCTVLWYKTAKIKPDEISLLSMPTSRKISSSQERRHGYRQEEEQQQQQLSPERLSFCQSVQFDVWKKRQCEHQRQHPRQRRR